MLEVSLTLHVFTLSFIKPFGLIAKNKDVMMLLEMELRVSEICSPHHVAILDYFNITILKY